MNALIHEIFNAQSEFALEVRVRIILELKRTIYDNFRVLTSIS